MADPLEGRTANGPNGPLIRRNGAWRAKWLTVFPPATRSTRLKVVQTFRQVYYA